MKQKEIVVKIRFSINEETKLAKSFFSVEENGEKKDNYSFADALLISRALVMYSGKMLNNCASTVKELEQYEGYSRKGNKDK